MPSGLLRLFTGGFRTPARTLGGAGRCWYCVCLCMSWCNHVMCHNARAGEAFALRETHLWILQQTAACTYLNVSYVDVRSTYPCNRDTVYACAGEACGVAPRYTQACEQACEQVCEQVCEQARSVPLKPNSQKWTEEGLKSQSSYLPSPQNAICQFKSPRGWAHFSRLVVCLRPVRLLRVWVSEGLTQGDS